MSTLAFRGGLLSSPAAVFWVLQPWQVGPVGFHRFMPRISDGATASFERSSFLFIFTKTYDAMEIHERWEQKWKNAFFLARIGFEQNILPRTLRSWNTNLLSSQKIFSLSPSSQVEPFTKHPEKIKERRRQHLKKLRPRKLRSN